VKRQPDHIDAWGAYFSDRRPLIQWVCRLSDREAADAMRRLGLIKPAPAPLVASDDGPMLWDLLPEKTPAAAAGVREEVAA
jgi:hypothetical protein